MLVPNTLNIINNLNILSKLLLNPLHINTYNNSLLKLLPIINFLQTIHPNQHNLYRQSLPPHSSPRLTPPSPHLLLHHHRL